MDSAALKAQQEPHWPWLFTADTTPWGQTQGGGGKAKVVPQLRAAAAPAAAVACAYRSGPRGLSPPVHCTRSLPVEA